MSAYRKIAWLFLCCVSVALAPATASAQQTRAGGDQAGTFPVTLHDEYIFDFSSDVDPAVSYMVWLVDPALGLSGAPLTMDDPGDPNDPARPAEHYEYTLVFLQNIDGGLSKTIHVESAGDLYGSERIAIPGVDCVTKGRVQGCFSELPDGRIRLIIRWLKADGHWKVVFDTGYFDPNNPPWSQLVDNRTPEEFWNDVMTRIGPVLDAMPAWREFLVEYGSELEQAGLPIANPASQSAAERSRAGSGTSQKSQARPGRGE